MRCASLTAPWIIDKAMNRAAFDTYVETQLAPTLHRGDVVILDNLPVHESAKAAQILKAKGAWFLFLPLYSRDLNPKPAARISPIWLSVVWPFVETRDIGPRNCS